MAANCSSAQLISADSTLAALAVQGVLALGGRDVGWCVSSLAADGDQAVAQVREHQPDVVLMEDTAPEERPSPELLESLSAREREVLAEVAAGWSNAEIGKRLHISAATAKTHVSRLLMKLDAHDRAQLVMIAYETGLRAGRNHRREPDQYAASTIHELKSILQTVDRQPAPALLPILRSQQQGEILALLLGDPDLELSLTEIAARVGVPHPSVYREIQRAEQAGLVTSRRVGNTRLVQANTASPYYAGLAEVLVRAFGAPAVLAEVLRAVDGITGAYIYGSWAARYEGQIGQRPVGDIDLLVLGEPDRDQLYAALSTAEQRLARPVQATIRDQTWLESGSGSFHETIANRPMVRLAVPHD